jgi:DNA-binding response OmpR family regulator
VFAVNDEENVLEPVRYNFHKEGFKVDTAPPAKMH